MKGIVIAAGVGSRMGSLTDNAPKCMLPINSRPLLHYTMDYLRAAGCNEIVVIVGYKADKVDAPGSTIVSNDDYANNNILHSLMSAAPYLDGPVMCSYSDIWVEPDIHKILADTEGDIALAVDGDWLPYYEGRKDHPVDEAENVYFDNARKARQVGKHLHPDNAESLICGEFLGLWRMSAAGTRLLRETFEELDSRLDTEEPFQRAAVWRKAYITDIVQELIDRGVDIDCAVIERGWAELDTVEDYQRLDEIAERQSLLTLCASRVEQ
jgi:choline kinase